jgi:hypothetical protein
MPNVPDLPGMGIVVAMTKRTRAVAMAAGAGALAVGGFVVKRVLGHGEDQGLATAPKPDRDPPQTTGTDAPPRPGAEPGNIAGDDRPHSALSNPVVDDPDLTEYPDPYDTREDPRDPVDPDDAPFGEQPHPQTGAGSTSEPPPQQDPEVGERAKPPRRENLDD